MMLNASALRERIARLELIIGYQFADKKNAIKALSTYLFRLWIRDVGWVWIDKNDRVAIYGDRLADAYLCKEWVKSSFDRGMG